MFDCCVYYVYHLKYEVAMSFCKAYGPHQYVQCLENNINITAVILAKSKEIVFIR